MLFFLLSIAAAVAGAILFSFKGWAWAILLLSIGAMTGLVSNFLFGQGPWTPFQMLTWELIGFLSGILAEPLQKSRILLFFTEECMEFCSLC